MTYTLEKLVLLLQWSTNPLIATHTLSQYVIPMWYVSLQSVCHPPSYRVCSLHVIPLPGVRVCSMYVIRLQGTWCVSVQSVRHPPTWCVSVQSVRHPPSYLVRECAVLSVRHPL